MAATSPDVKFTAQVVSGRLEVEYQLRNSAGSPILVFDRMYDMVARDMDANWCDIEVVESRVILKREVAALPFGLHFDNPVVPYGRVVAAGELAKGTVKIALPLRERGPYYHITHRGNEVQLRVSRVTFRLGWAPCPAGAVPASGSTVEVGGEALTLFSHGRAMSLQQLATARDVNATLEVMARR